MSDYLETRRNHQDPLFIHFDRNPLTFSQFSHIMKQELRILGLPLAAFSPHSLRIGAATSAAMQVLVTQISKLWGDGNWQLSSYTIPGLLNSFLRRCSIDHV